MKISLKALASLVLASAVAGQAHSAFAADPAPAPKTTKHVRVKKSARPTVQSQIEALRKDMEAQKSQIDTLQQQLSARDAQLQQVQQQSQMAVQQATEQTQAAVAAQQAQTAENTTAVSSLKSSVDDLKANNVSMVSTMQSDQAATKKAIENPDLVHFKGVGLSFTNSFIEFATVDRTRATGSDINTPFLSIPFSGADAGQMSEFFASGRQSRLAIGATGKLSSATLQAYYELDWLGAGITSNDNQSNSYVMRERQLWAQAALKSGLTITGGQQWTLATETRNGMDNKTEILPDTIDPQYNVGFVWARQPGFRVTQNFGNKLWVGASIEQSQLITPSCVATGNVTPAAGTTAAVAAACPSNYVAGAAGTNGGLFNASTVYSYNLAPDIVGKVAYQNKYGHAELFAIGSFLRNRVYPVQTAAGAAAAATGAYNNTTFAGGIGGGVRGYAMQKKVEIALHGLYGDGIGRYASAQMPDTTVRPNGTFAPLHNYAALGEIFMHATPRLDVYTDWGVEGAQRRIFNDGGGFVGYGLRTSNNTGCYNPVAPAATATSGALPVQTVGYLPASPANCGGSNKDVTEGTIGADYYFYKGPMGRFRSGLQYSWMERALWSGSTGTSPKAIDNVIETNVRYYLP